MKRPIFIQIAFLLLLLCVYSCGSGRNESAGLIETADRMKANDENLKALQCYTQGFMAAQSEGNDFAAMRCAGNISILYHCFGNMEGCFHYGHVGYRLAVKLKEIDKQSAFLSNFVTYYSEIGDTAKALKYLDELTKLQPSDMRRHLYYCLYEQAQLYKAKHEADSALIFHQKALEFAEENGMAPIYTLFQNSEIGNILVQQGHYGEAIAMGKKCLSEAVRLKSNDMEINAYKMLADAYEKTGVQDSAYVFIEKYSKLNSKVYDMQKFFSVQNDLFLYENSVREQHISKLTIVNVLISLMAVCLAVMMWIIIRKNKTLRRTQKILVNNNKELIKIERRMRNGRKEEPEPEPANKESYVISDKKKEELLKRIMAVFDDTSVISDVDFNLNRLAELVNSNTKYVSVVINELCHKSFKSMLTEYRIREVCRRLNDERYERYTIKTIYEDVGYRNAASFNRCFKSVMGMTPSVYQKLSSETEATEEEE